MVGRTEIFLVNKIYYIGKTQIQNVCAILIENSLFFPFVNREVYDQSLDIIVYYLPLSTNYISTPF